EGSRAPPGRSLAEKQIAAPTLFTRRSGLASLDSRDKPRAASKYDALQCPGVASPGQFISSRSDGRGQIDARASTRTPTRVALRRCGPRARAAAGGHDTDDLRNR